MDRVRARKNHYMKDYMVRSQFEGLEAPAEDEDDELGVEAGGSSEEVRELEGRVVEGVLRGDVGLWMFMVIGRGVKESLVSHGVIFS